MAYTVLSKHDLPRAEGTGTATFEGQFFGETNVSFFWVDLPPGARVRMHRHPCEEVFVVQEGRVSFTIGAKILEAEAGQVIIVSADTPHAFTNVGSGPLRQIDILPNRQIITEWLEP